MGNAYGIDIGTSNFKMCCSDKDKILNEKNIIAIANKTEILAFGDEAYEMYEKAPEHIEVSFPVKFGVIADIENMQTLLFNFFNKINEGKKITGSDFYIAVPTDVTEVEKRAFYELVVDSKVKAKNVYVVDKPDADAIGAGLDVTKSKGIMIVNIGAQSTQFSVITDGKIIIARKIPIGGRQMNEAICNEIRKRYNLQIGTRTGKRLKLAMGRLNDQRKDARKVVGIDGISGLPREEVISGYVVNAGIMNCVNEIAAEMKTFLERIPPQISYHIARQGIYITGGSTRLPYIDQYLASYTGFTFNLSDLYEKSAVTGLEKIIRNKDLRKWAVPVTQRKL